MGAGVNRDQPALSAGFWLSFVAVALLVWWFTPWVGFQRAVPVGRILSVQLALLVAMLIPLLLFMGRASWLAPIMNLVAVPWVSFVTVPLTLLGVALHSLWSYGAIILWQLADYSIGALWWLIDWVPDRLGFMVAPMAFDAWGIVAGCLAVVGLVLPRQLPRRWLFCVPLGVLLLAAKPQPPFRLTVLDVGQGLAVVIEAADKTLVYDAGPIYGDRFNAGSGIIAPYLWRRGRSSIDRLIVSHEDGDHSGGLTALLKTLPVTHRLVGPAVELQGAERCLAGDHWQWGQGIDRVSFTLLSPVLGGATEGNNSSCVLLVKWRDQTILLPGDIEASVERQLAFKSVPITLLVAPHHGSKTSSTEEFVRQLHPEIVVFSSGYRHHFGHPHSSVVARYTQIKSRLWRTSDQGAISFSWDQYGKLTATAQRGSEPERWWR